MDYKKATDYLPTELTPVWVRVMGHRPRKMYRIQKTFYYYNKVLDRNGNYCSIGESVLWRYVKE
jgi:hypothetical protein